MSTVIPKSIQAVVASSNNKIESIRLIIKAKPGAKKSQIISIDDEAIGVQISARPRYLIFFVQIELKSIENRF